VASHSAPGSDAGVAGKRRVILTERSEVRSESLRQPAVSIRAVQPDASAPLPLRCCRSQSSVRLGAELSPDPRRHPSRGRTDAPASTRGGSAKAPEWYNEVVQRSARTAYGEPLGARKILLIAAFY
jgi:hypothetical protein